MAKDGGQMLATPEEWAAQYGIHLLPDELDWLRTKSSALDVATRAAKHRLLLALRPERCPVCTWVLCERSSWDAAPPIPALKIDRAQQLGGFHHRKAQEHAGRTEQHCKAFFRHDPASERTFRQGPLHARRMPL